MFAISGALAAEHAGMDLLGCVALAAIAGIVDYLLLKAAGLRLSWAVAAGVLVILGPRLCAVPWGWHLLQLHPVA